MSIHKEALEVIKKRLSERYPKIIEHIQHKEYKEAAFLILPYYDKSYTKGLARRDEKKCTTLSLDKDSPSETARKLIRMKK